MRFLRWMNKISNAPTDPWLAEKLSDNKTFKKIILSVFTAPEKFISKLEKHLDPEHNPNPVTQKPKLLQSNENKSKD